MRRTTANGLPAMRRPPTNVPRPPQRPQHTRRRTRRCGLHITAPHHAWNITNMKAVLAEPRGVVWVEQQQSKSVKAACARGTV